MTHRVNLWIRRKLEEVRVVYGSKCCRCGDREGLEFAHVRDNGFNGRGRGRKERYYNIKNHPDYYRLMCGPCHRYYDEVLKDPDALPH